MKLIEIVTITFLFIGVLLAACDSESWTWFLWSKVVAAVLLGTTILLINKGNMNYVGNEYSQL